MSSIDSPKHTVIRVKRRADEEKSISNKRCKFVGTCGSGDDKDIYQLLTTSETLPQNAIKDEKQLKICDFEDVCDSVVMNFKSKDIITCNGQPLESVENRLNESFEYLYDIYVLEDNQRLDFDYQLRECLDSDDDSNDENYVFNDYPDDNEVSEDVVDYYDYGDHQNDSQRDLELGFNTNNKSSDYEVSDEEIDALDMYLKSRRLDDSEDEDIEEEEEDD